MDRVWHCFTRRKPVQLQPSEVADSSRRSLSVFDLVFYGIGSMCGGSIYGISVVLLATTSGAGSFISSVLAGLVALLNAQSYAELSARLPHGCGGGYSFTYVACGELLAFITGWAMILEYLLNFSFGCVGAANAVDLMANHSINLALQQKLGLFPSTNGYLGASPNILAGVFALLITAVLGFGVRLSMGINSSIAIFSTGILLGSAGYMAGNANSLNTTLKAVNPATNATFLITAPVNAFAPFGISGLIRGAAITFNAFGGFDAISLASDVTINPMRAIPLAINIAVLVVLLISVIYYLCLSFYMPWFLADPQLGLSGVFYYRKVVSMQMVASVGEITGYVSNAFCSMFALSHIVMSLAHDGLLFSFLRYVPACLQIPVWVNLSCGLLAAALAIILDLQILANFMSAGTLMTYTCVTISLLLLRLMATDQDTTEPADSASEGACGSALTLSTEKITLDPRVGVSRCCRPVPLLVVSLLLLVVSQFLTSKLLTSTEPVITSIAGRLSVSVFGCVAIVVSVSALLLFHYLPSSCYPLSFVPAAPLLTISANVIMASQLDTRVWYRVGIWHLIGIIIYTGYGVHHSLLGAAPPSSPFVSSLDKKNEKTCLLQQSSRAGSEETLALNTS